MLNKNCVICGKLFFKKVNCSRFDWDNSKYCSRNCASETLFHKGKPSWNKGLHRNLNPKNSFKKGFKWSDEVKAKMRGRIPWNKNTHPSEETIEKIRQARLNQKNVVVFQSGEQHPNWKGGVTDLSIRLRNLEQYKTWRKSVFQRDNYTCLNCGRGGSLNADHIKPFSLIIHENSIDKIEKALKCHELWDLNNGRTLCVKCHKETETYAKNTRFKYLK